MATTRKQLLALYLANIKEMPSGCVEWQRAKNAYGYGVTCWLGKTKLAHRAAWFLASGEWPTLQVLHKCDNPSCVRLEHLFLGTPKDNALDKSAKGRAKGNPNGVGRGETHPCAKLTDDQARQVIAANGPQKEIATQFGICQQTVSDLKRGKRRVYLGATHG